MAGCLNNPNAVSLAQLRSVGKSRDDLIVYGVVQLNEREARLLNSPWCSYATKEWIRVK